MECRRHASCRCAATAGWPMARVRGRMASGGLKMRIAYLCTDLEIHAFGNAGASVHIRQFTDALVDAGHDVCIIGPWSKATGSDAPKARVYQIQPDGTDAFV